MCLDYLIISPPSFQGEGFVLHAVSPKTLTFLPMVGTRFSIAQIRYASIPGLLRNKSGP